MNDSFKDVKSFFSKLEKKAKEITEIKGKLDVLKQNKLKLKDSYDLQHKANPTEWEERSRILGFYKNDMEHFLVDVCSMVDWTCKTSPRLKAGAFKQIKIFAGAGLRSLYSVRH